MRVFGDLFDDPICWLQMWQKICFQLQQVWENQSQRDACNGALVYQMTTNILLNGNMKKIGSV